jgi:hypothetical protein
MKNCKLHKRCSSMLAYCSYLLYKSCNHNQLVLRLIYIPELQRHYTCEASPKNLLTVNRQGALDTLMVFVSNPIHDAVV